MTRVHTREEALTLVDTSMARFDEEIGGVLTQASAIAQNAAWQAEGVVGRCATKVQVLESVNGSAAEEDRRRISADLVRAREQLDQARRAFRRVVDVADGLHALQRSYIQRSRPLIAEGRRHLAGRKVAVEQYLSSGGGGNSHGGAFQPVAGSENLGAVLEGMNLGLVSVASADLDETPIQDGFTRGGLSRSDYRWAVQTWDDTVGPGVARGMTRDDFAAYDNREPPAPPLRRTADVYDLFLGTNAIRADRRPDGTLNIINGRHRLRIARELGIKDLPGRVTG